MITLADISEWQESLDAPAYIAAGHSCLIIRAHSGYRPDKLWASRRDYVRQYPFAALGYYQFLVTSRPATEQAHDFIACVGTLRPNEFAICDSEEGAGDQTARVQAWFDVIDRFYGRTSTLYASESWFKTKLGGAARWKRPRWMAAYRSTEPTDPHELWQNTDCARFPGISGLCDGNIFHGTAPDFRRTFCGTAAPSPTHPPQEEDDMPLTCGLNADGSFHVFQEMPDHSIRYTWQKKGETTWHGGKSGVAPAGMTPFAPAPKKS